MPIDQQKETTDRQEMPIKAFPIGKIRMFDRQEMPMNALVNALVKPALAKP